MKNKIILAATVAGLLVVAIIYAAFSFFNLSANPAVWSKMDRGAFSAVCGFVLIIAVTTIVAAITTQEDE